MLRQFLQRMPKGGDLHSHLHGAVYAETYLDCAGKDHYCVDRAQRTLVNPPCTVGGALVSAEALDTATYNALLDRMSTRNLAESGQSGHDRFFESFSVFGRTSSDQGLMAVLLAEVTNRAAAEHLNYLELMVTIQGGPVDQLADELARSPAAAPAPDGTLDFAAIYRWLLDHGLRERVAAGRAELDRWDADYARLQGCGTANPVPGCVVGVRWLQQSGRNKSAPIVFGRLVFAFALAQADPRVVGLNLVGPEDDRVALRDYGLQMQMLQFLSGQVPGVKVALHAGELTLGLVPPEALWGHVREAVTVAGARRIGHGVDIGYEDGALDVLKTMREGRVAVEVCLTSNDLIPAARRRGSSGAWRRPLPPSRISKTGGPPDQARIDLPPCHRKMGLTEVCQR
jgi:adenosine deaminase/adenosine deaminase CECR1